ncbi:MAG: hypothetical protein KJO79_01545 [Verrucomicrobiae bacterium]|nr:hypothetical protein [Verrucomicrobiae bacterium]NNJ85831.1 hypothetical protein [Akkermansiaceae bacterium]
MKLSHRTLSVAAMSFLMVVTCRATEPRSPCALSLSSDKQSIYVAELTGSSVAIVDMATLKLKKRHLLEGEITGVASYGKNILATSSHNRGELIEVEATSGKITRRVKWVRVPVPHWLISPTSVPMFVIIS